MGGSGGARGRPPRRPPGCARARPAATTLPHLRSTTGGTGRRARAFGRAHHPLNGNSGGRGRRGLRPRLPEFACGWARLAEFQGAGPPSAQTRAPGRPTVIIAGGARSSGTSGGFLKIFFKPPHSSFTDSGLQAFSGGPESVRWWGCTESWGPGAARCSASSNPTNTVCTNQHPRLCGARAPWALLRCVRSRCALDTM